MKTVTLSVATREALTRRALDAFSGKRRGAHISFASADLLWKVLTAKRWELLKAMTGGGAMTLREAARRAERDVKAVHGDVHALLAAGVLRRNADRKISRSVSRGERNISNASSIRERESVCTDNNSITGFHTQPARYIQYQP